MEQVTLARIAVSAAAYPIDKPYTYLVPAELKDSLRPGMRVTVPFGRGNRPSEGMVLAVEEGEKAARLKSVGALLDSQSVMTEGEIRLALWMRERYFCTFYDAAKTILPAGIWYQLQVLYRKAEHAPEAPLTASEQDILTAVEANGGEMERDAIRALCGEKTAGLLTCLTEKGYLTRREVSRRAIHDKTVKMVSLAMAAEEAVAEAEKKKRSAPMRYEVIRLLASVGQISAEDIRYFTGASAATVKSLEKAGIVRTWKEEVFRVPEIRAPKAEDICLTDEQQAVFRELWAMCQSGRTGAALLEGVTGSGKTQVYIRLVQEVIRAGKSAIVLVPEIALTAQIMERFSAHFGEKVAMLHSSRPTSERYDQWKRIRRGEVSVVLGTRSAVFAPLENIGLIILDEEQESSYQSENAPRYHARDIAKFRCAQSGALLLLGSATPAIESAYFARKGDYRHFRLTARYNRQALPRVILSDMRKELRNGNDGLIGAELKEELTKNLERGEQSILFLNRRGNSRMLLCGECGAAPECPRCSIPLTYHSANGRLMCHYCGHSQKAEENCPHCGGAIKRVGCGTQKAEDELRALFPEVKILRMDADTVNASHRHEEIFETFSKEKIPILLGTQMVAKGLDFSDVTLVGVLSADQSLYVDHYRAAERTFSLLTQVVGRAGRGGKEGRAVIQTFTPENDVILLAARQEYDAFFESEIRMRRARKYPPFADLFTVTVTGEEEMKTARVCAELKSAMEAALQLRQFAELALSILGPAPAAVVKVNNRYRYRLVITGRNDKPTRDFLSHYVKAFYNNKENRGLQLLIDCNAAD